MIVRTYQTETVRARIAATPPAPEKPARIQRPWTEDEVATLDRMRAEGRSYGRIARKMGRTRNSLIGFDWRRRNP